MFFYFNLQTDPGVVVESSADMADLVVGAWYELRESEAGQALMFCLDASFPGKSCFFVDLVSFILLCLQVAVFLKTTRRDGNLAPFT